MAQRVTLLAINAKYIHSALSVWCLARAARERARLAHEITVVEGTINQPEAELLAQITQTRPHVLGISVYIWNAGRVEALLRGVRRLLPDTTLILGGPEAGYNAAHWLARGAHIVVQGAGEGSFPRLLDALSAGDAAALAAIPGLWRLIEGKPSFSGADTSAVPAVDPYSEAYWDALGDRIAYLETSRGCPFRCAFCLSGGSALRFFPLEEAKAQLLRLSRSGAQTVKLVDRTFNCNPRRAYALFEYVIALDTPCRFHFEVAADLFDRQTLALLRTAPPGRIQLEAGLQSFNQPTLDALARKTSLIRAEQNLKTLLAGGNIHLHVDLIAGLPHETLELFKQSFNRAYAIGAHTLQLGFLKLLHGSALRAQAGALGLCYSAAPPYEITGSPWLSPGELEIIKQAEHALERLYNSGRFLETMAYALRATGLPPFELYAHLGRAVSGYRVPLGRYARGVYACLCALPGVETQVLRDCMVRDWLCAMGGVNLPEFLRTGGQTEPVRAWAQTLLGVRPARCQVAALGQGGGAFVDIRRADPVTGRYALYTCQPHNGVYKPTEKE